LKEKTYQALIFEKIVGKVVKQNYKNALQSQKPQCDKLDELQYNQH